MKELFRPSLPMLALLGAVAGVFIAALTSTQTSGIPAPNSMSLLSLALLASTVFTTYRKRKRATVTRRK